MSGKAAKIVFTEKRQSVLEQIHRSTTASQRLVQRAGIILMAFAGALNTDIANQTEIVFGIAGRRAVRRGNFASLDALKERLLQFIDDFNRTFAKPFRWTDTARPITAKTVKRPTTWKESWGGRRTNSETTALVD